MPGVADENAEVRRENHVGVAAGGEAGFDGAVIDGHEKARHFAGGNAGVGSKLDRSGRTDAQSAALGQRDFGRGRSGSHGAVGGNERSASDNLQRAGDHGGAAGNAAVERNDGNGIGGIGRCRNEMTAGALGADCALREAHEQSGTEEGQEETRVGRRREAASRYISRKFLIIWWPPCVSTLSGWNCTPSMGNLR